MNNLLPLVLLVATESNRARRDRLLTAAAPALVPGAVAQRTAVAVVMADQQARDDERARLAAEERVARDAAGALEIALEHGRLLSEQELAGLPDLDRVLQRLPDVRQRVVRGVAVPCDPTVPTTSADATRAAR